MRKVQFSAFGFSSILLMFVMICIVTFSTLTLVTANSDYKLSKKVATKSSNYYKAEEAIYNRIQELDNNLYETYKSTASDNSYYLSLNLSEDHFITLKEDINENQYLEVILEIQYPQNDTDSFYTIQKWSLVNVPVMVEDSGWNLMGE